MRGETTRQALGGIGFLIFALNPQGNKRKLSIKSAARKSDSNFLLGSREHGDGIDVSIYPVMRDGRIEISRSTEIQSHPQ